MQLYKSGFAGWNVAHFHSKYKAELSVARSWVPEAVWDLVVTMDDATSEHTSMFFCAQEGTASSFHGLGQTIARYGLFASLYSDRGSHYFTTPEAGGKVDQANLTEVGRALSQSLNAGSGSRSPTGGQSARATPARCAGWRWGRPSAKKPGPPEKPN